MKLVRSFFRATRVFFIISQLMLGLIFAYCAAFLLEDAQISDLFSAGFFIMLALALLWSFYAGLFRGGAHKIIRYSTGSVLIILGFMLSYSTLAVFGFAEASVILFVPLWLLVAGLYEIFGGSKLRAGSISSPVSGSSLNS